jgi:hypothetical protein
MEILTLSEANPEFMTENSRLTAIHLCLKYQRTAVLERLEELDVSYPDDGLHVAALYALPEVCERLLQSGHHAQRPDIHTGRTPLAELCLNGAYNGDTDVSDWRSRVRKTMEVLVRYTDMSVRFGPKTTLHLALDNNNPGSAWLVEALLSSWNPWNIPYRDDIYLFGDVKGMSYSPTKYVEYCCPSKSSVDKTFLINILRNHRFTDRYFATGGQMQPAGAVGLPPAVEAAVIAQQEAQKQYQMANHQRQLASHQHQITEYEVALAKWKHDSELEEQAERERERMKLDRKWHRQIMQQHQEKADLFIHTLDRAVRRGLIEKPFDVEKAVKLLQDNDNGQSRLIKASPYGDMPQVEELVDGKEDEFEE